MQLNKSVAFITGGAQGLGKRFAENLLKRGAKVVVADIDGEAGEKLKHESDKVFGNNKLHFVKSDLSNGGELIDAFEEAQSHFGQLDIVCNNAGIMSLNPQQSRLQVDLNLTAVIEGTFKGIDLMSTQNGGNGGVIINVASAAGLEPMPGHAVYTATKHAVVAFSRTFQTLPYHSLHGVRVNCICPFFVDTALVRNALEKNPKGLAMIDKIGWVDIEDVSKAFIGCVEDTEMNAKVTVVAPPDKIFEMQFEKKFPKLATMFAK